MDVQPTLPPTVATWASPAMLSPHREKTESVPTTVDDFLVAALRAEGVRVIFAHPGPIGMPLFDRLDRSGIDVVFLRHEQSAAHAADGYARTSADADVGVCLVTAGAGVSSAITGIATAHLDSIPMVVLVVQGVLDGSEVVDSMGVTRSCVKHSLVLSDADQLETVVKKAFHLARTGRPGPVLIEFTAEVLGAIRTRPFDYSDAVVIPAYRVNRPPPRNQIRIAVEAIRDAKRPLIYYGGGVIAGNAHLQLRALAELTGAPVTGTLMGLGAFDATHPQWLGMLGMHGLYEANMAMQHCDVLIAIGARFDDRVIGDPVDFARPQRRIIHIDIDPTSIDKRVAVDIPIVGHCGRVLDALIAQLGAHPGVAAAQGDWWQVIGGWRAARCLVYPRALQAIKPQRVIEVLSNLPGAGDFIVTSDVGQHQMWTAQYFQFREPRRWVNSGGLGTMGYGLPAAIGAATGHPGRTIVCVSGDGSIQMSSKELITCLQYGLAIKIICLNNSQLGMVRQQQDLYHGRRRSHSYMEALPDFVALAEAYGHRGVRITDDNQLAPTLHEVFSDREQLVFVDVVVDRSENVYPTLAPGRPLTDMLLRAPVAAEDL
jgi:acetolactate synthase-1/2/3 large subunit